MRDRVWERNPGTYPDEHDKTHIHPNLFDLVPPIRAVQLSVRAHPWSCCLFLLNQAESLELLEHSDEEERDLVERIVLPQTLGECGVNGMNE
jgi:hypothetical protein